MTLMSDGFTPAVGSSSRHIFGLAIKMRPRSTSLRWPPERLPTYSLPTRVRPSRASTSLARARFWRSSAEHPRQAQQGAGQIELDLVLCGEQQVLNRRHALSALRELEGADQAQAGNGIRRAACEGRTAETDLAPIALLKPGDDVEKRALAGSIGTDQAHDAALADPKAHIVQSPERPNFLETWATSSIAAPDVAPAFPARAGAGFRSVHLAEPWRPPTAVGKQVYMGSDCCPQLVYNTVTVCRWR